MGKPFERHSRLFALSIATVLADQKAPIRTAALQTLTAMATACDGLDSMVSGFTTALETTNPLQKSTLLLWMVDWFKDHEATEHLDLHSWATPIVNCLDDRNGDVRKGAQGLLPTIIKHAGFDFVMQQTNSLKPASRASAVPLIQAARPVAVVDLSSQSVKLSVTIAKVPTVPAIVDTPDSPISVSVPGPKTVNKLAGVRRKLPLGTIRPDSRNEFSQDTAKSAVSGIKRSNATTTSTPSPPSTLLPFFGVNPDLKKTRLGKDAQRWINEGGPTRKDLAEVLQSQMESNASKDLVMRLFSHDHNAVNDHISGLTTISDFYSGACGADESVEAVCVANFDLPLKYVSIKAHEPQPNLISKCLDVVEAVLGFLRSINYQLTDPEAICFVPTVVYKVCLFATT